MSNDVTKPNNHIYWLWLAFAALDELIGGTP